MKTPDFINYSGVSAVDFKQVTATVDFKQVNATADFKQVNVNWDH